jgi:hypothetical protein
MIHEATNLFWEMIQLDSELTAARHRFKQLIDGPEFMEQPS